jgi:hypothetical protein
MTTDAQIQDWQDAAKQGTIEDELNPVYLLNGTSTQLLVKIASGEIDAVALARHQLRNKSLDDNGKWVGFGE